MPNETVQPVAVIKELALRLIKNFSPSVQASIARGELTRASAPSSRIDVVVAPDAVTKMAELAEQEFLASDGHTVYTLKYRAKGSKYRRWDAKEGRLGKEQFLRETDSFSLIVPVDDTASI
jgi:hypothetical protein